MIHESHSEANVVDAFGSPQKTFKTIGCVPCKTKMEDTLTEPISKLETFFWG